MPVHNLNFPHSRIIIKKNNNKKKKHPNKNPVIRRQWAEITEKKPATSRPGTTTKNKQQKKYVKKKNVRSNDTQPPRIKNRPSGPALTSGQPDGGERKWDAGVSHSKDDSPETDQGFTCAKGRKGICVCSEEGSCFSGSMCVCVRTPPICIRTHIVRTECGTVAKMCKSDVISQNWMVRFSGRSIKIKIPLVEPI